MSDATMYGPSALATPANAVTALRMLVSPILFVMISNDKNSWPIFILWVVLAGTDGIDGWIARRHGTTRSGAFLDPLADKVLILGAMIFLVSVDRFSWVPVAIIAAREVFITLYRSYWQRSGLAVPARKTAKAKTFAQAIAVGGAVFPPLASPSLWWIADAVLWVSVALAVLSAAQYVLDGNRAATTMEPAA